MWPSWEALPALELVQVLTTIHSTHMDCGEKEHACGVRGGGQGEETKRQQCRPKAGTGDQEKGNESSIAQKFVAQG